MISRTEPKRRGRERHSWRLVDACRRLVECEQAIRVPDHEQSTKAMQDAFAEAWLDMKEALEKLGGKHEQTQDGV